jgi:hypothetical protein
MIALIHQPQIPIYRDFAGQVSLVIINSTIHFWPLITRISAQTASKEQHVEFSFRPDTATENTEFTENTEPALIYNQSVLSL